MHAKKLFKGMLGTVGLAAALIVGLPGTAAHAQGSKNDAQIQKDLTDKLDHKRFSGVKSDVKNGVVTLTGTVDVFSTKEDAEHRANRIKNVIAVHDQIAVGSASGEVSDKDLRDKLADKLAYDRVGYGSTAFNSFTIGVQDGVVTLGGVAYSPMDKGSALSLVSNYPGVKDVIDNVEVAPTSPNDDRIRLAVARAVYGFPSLNKYAIDPAKPIRIVVVNGNVTLAGVVDNQGDKDAAFIRANGVSGVFKVTNELQVANSKTAEK